MTALYSCLLVTEPDYGDRVLRIHSGVSEHYFGVDLLTGEEIRVPVTSRWDADTDRWRLVCADGWAARQVNLRHAESLVGLPAHSLPAITENEHRDLWADKRLRDPVFIAVTEALVANPKIVFDSTDWRDWVHEHAPHGQKTPTRNTRWRDCTSLYMDGGDGSIERFAYHIRRWLPPSSPSVVSEGAKPLALASDALLAAFRQSYEWQLECERTGWETKAHPRQPVRTAEEIVDICAIDRPFLDAIDERVAQLDAELAPVRARFAPQPPALALFYPGALRMITDQLATVRALSQPAGTDNHHLRLVLECSTAYIHPSTNERLTATARSPDRGTARIATLDGPLTVITTGYGFFVRVPTEFAERARDRRHSRRTSGAASICGG